jgi:dipeptidyl aminopeptidase/acylaminoacyl peptidase
MLCKHSIDPTLVSPVLHIKPGISPAIIFQGTEDTSVPIWTHREFSKRMKDAGNICELVEFEGRRHSFTSDPVDRKATMDRLETFLKNLGYEIGNN